MNRLTHLLLGTAFLLLTTAVCGVLLAAAWLLAACALRGFPHLFAPGW